ncbi:hypothetical protein ACQKQD_18890 [Methylobacterium sp. NPDC080182]|uniref:hypothetical protein n=1 Tax=Methylobacterium sp. NPDC080182 TaxID=3390590 RepID=UPI003D07F94A
MAFMSSASAKFLAEIRIAASRLNLSPATLCQKAVKNGRLVRRLEEGQSVTLNTVEKIRAFVRASGEGAAA